MTTFVMIYLAVYFVVWVAVFIIASERLEHFRGRQPTWTELIMLAVSMPYSGFVLLLLLDEKPNEDN